MRVSGSRFSAHEIEIFRIGKEAAERDAAEAAGRLTSAGNLPAKSGRVRARIAEACGVSRRTVDKIAEIYAAERADPAMMARIVADLDRTGKVDGAHRQMKRAQDRARVLGLAPIAGRFLTGVIDPPWEDPDVSEAQRPPYATLPLDEIRELPVSGWFGAEAHLYVHAPPNFVRAAFELVEHWEFDAKSLIAWKKSKWSMGRYFRTQDEFVIFATRGGLQLLRQDLPNHFDGPVGEHSEKPESFYDLVRAASPPTFCEGFGRRDRPDFTPLFQPAPLAVAAK